MIRIVFVVLLVFSLVGCSQKQSVKGLPNVLFIAIDDLNACPDGFNGETHVSTPNIDSLARRGILFANAQCAAPACNPSRTSVLSGVAPYRSGVYLNWQDWRVNNMLKNWTTLPHHFKNNGYETLGGGKIYHAASLSKQGFTGLLDPRPWDEYFPSKSRQMPAEVLPERVPMNGNKSFYGGRFDWAPLDIKPNEMADAKVVEWAEGKLSQKHQKPLFLAVGIYRPHIPWYTPKIYFDKHPIDQVKLPEIVENDLADIPEAGQKMARRSWHKWMVENNKWAEAIQGYNASVSFTDDMVGRLLKALDDGPMANNTIVVLWSDHGYHLGQKEHWEKFALWEQTTHVPLIIAAPGEFMKGKSCQQVVSLLDIYPTLADLCHIPPTVKLDGKSLVPLLQDPDKEGDRAVVTTQGYMNHAVRTNRWRYIRYQDGSEELYDQENDPKDFINLAGEEAYQFIKQDLAHRLPVDNAELQPAENYNKKAKK